MELGLFDEVSDALRGLLPDGFGDLRTRPRRYGIKVWFDEVEPPREHYEAQVIGAKLVDDADVLALEIGFHSEHPKVTDNDRVLDALLARERDWRRVVGDAAVAGPFLGRADTWRRISETWPDPDLGLDDLSLEVAACLIDYIRALEPVRPS